MKKQLFYLLFLLNFSPPLLCMAPHDEKETHSKLTINFSPEDSFLLQYRNIPTFPAYLKNLEIPLNKTDQAKVRAFQAQIAARQAVLRQNRQQ